MSKLVFYFGAGASIGNNPDSVVGVENRHEGVPVVSELPTAFEEFKNMIELVRIPNEDIEVCGDLLTPAQIITERNEIIEGLDHLIPAIRQHATIDTFAKKLWLTNNKQDYCRIKKLLSLFLIWSQIKVKPDSRYDTMLASLLLQETLKFPSNISVITWNYDSQFELAYNAYSPNGLGVFDIFDSDLTLGYENGYVFKINGTASFFNSSSIRGFQKENDLLGYTLIHLYSVSDIPGSPYANRLSFAWEDTHSSNLLMNALDKVLEDTETLVVVGYSFPFFNREVDRSIFRKMYMLKKIYIQDPNALSIKQNIDSVLSDWQKTNKVEIHTKQFVNQFFLPPEI